MITITLCKSRHSKLLDTTISSLINGKIVAQIYIGTSGVVGGIEKYCLKEKIHLFFNNFKIEACCA